jgi:RimJ/RimL family protein N-acetyltransferase
MYKHKNGVTLRKLERSDLKKLKELKNESWFGTHNITFVNDLDQQRWFDGLDSSKTLILVAEYETNVFGLYKISNIDWVNRRYDSAHDVFESSRGRGLGKPLLAAGVDFGFEVLNMNRLDTEVLENNIASLKCALYAGFVEEGRKRKCIHKCGEYLDSIFLGIVRDEWSKLERTKHFGGTCNTSYIPKDGKH